MPSSVRHGSGCPKCAGRAYTLSDIKQLAKDNSFTLASKQFTNMTTKHKWRCQDGHEWLSTPSKIKLGSGCPICHTYRGEEKCRFVFEQITGEKFPKLMRAFGSIMEIDGYCEKLKMAFEYHGKQHYHRIKYWHKSEQDFAEQKNRDKQKAALCRQHDTNLLVVPYFEKTEAYVEDLLRGCGIDIGTIIDWSLFQGSAFRLQQVKEAANKIDLQCLSNNYISARFPMDFKCTKCGRRFQSTSNDVKNGYGCLKCGGKMKKTRSDMVRLAKDQGLLFLSHEYINARTKHEWECLRCNNVFEKIPSAIQQGEGCSRCARQRGWDKRRSRHLLTIP